MRSSVSMVGLEGPDSNMLMNDWLRPDWVASMFIESPRCSRVSRSRRISSARTAALSRSSGTLHRYVSERLTVHINILITPPAMFLRRVLPLPAGRCSGSNSCPDLLELATGDFAVIGTDITDEARPRLLPGSGCGEGERIVRVPRRLLVEARAHLPAA